MILLEIQENVTRVNNALNNFESSFIYKGFRTFGAEGNFELALRDIQNQLLHLRNSFLHHCDAIIRISENKEILTMIDSGYFDRCVQAASVESLIRVVNSSGFQIPETSLRVVSENRLVVNELQAISAEINAYNSAITSFRHRNNKFFFTLYKVPTGNELPDVIRGTVNLEGVLPNAHALRNYTGTQSYVDPTTTISIQSKSENNKIKITKKDSVVKKINITKKK